MVGVGLAWQGIVVRIQQASQLPVAQYSSVGEGSEAYSTYSTVLRMVY